MSEYWSEALRRRKLWFVALALVLVGCAKPKAPDPTIVRLTIVASADVNPDVNGRASPIVVRAYELKSPSGFTGASFIELFEKDKDILGADVQSREVMQLPPNGSKALEKEIKAETTHFAFFATYRDWQHARWSAIVEIPAGKTSNVLVRADKLAISAQVTQVVRPKK